MHQMEMLDRFCIPQNQSETAASCREFTLMHLASRPGLLIPFQSLLPGRLVALWGTYSLDLHKINARS